MKYSSGKAFSHLVPAAARVHPVQEEGVAISALRHHIQSADASLGRRRTRSGPGASSTRSAGDGVTMLHDHEMQDGPGGNGSRREGADLLLDEPSIARADAACDLRDALMHLSDVVMREMFAVSSRMNENFTHVVGDPAAGSAHTLIAQLNQRIKELRKG
jgi:hypothetical protein